MSSPIRRRQRGQALVEFAMIAPIFFVLLIAIFDIGRIVWAHNALENAAREGARYAIVHGGSVTTLCPTGPDQLARVFCDDYPVSPYDYTDNGTEAVRQTVERMAMGIGNDLAISVCYGRGCSGDAHADTNRRGAYVTVRVAATIPLIAAALFNSFVPGGFGPFVLDRSVTMIVNS